MTLGRAFKPGDLDDKHSRMDTGVSKWQTSGCLEAGSFDRG